MPHGLTATAEANEVITAVDSAVESGGVLHIADSENHRVVALAAADGRLLAEWAIADRRSEAHTPSRIAVHDDHLYAADPANDVIVVRSSRP